MMRFLVEVEGVNHTLVNRLETARATEARLRGRISMLGEQLSGLRTDIELVFSITMSCISFNITICTESLRISKVSPVCCFILLV